MYIIARHVHLYARHVDLCALPGDVLVIHVVVAQGEVRMVAEHFVAGRRGRPDRESVHSRSAHPP